MERDIDRRLRELEALLGEAGQNPSPATVDSVTVEARSPNAPIQTNRGENDLTARMRAFENIDPDMTTLEDVGRSLTSGLQHGGAMVLGLPGEIANLWGRGVDWLGEKAIGGLQDLTGNDLGAPYMGTRRPGRRDPATVDYAAINYLPTTSQYDEAIQSIGGDYHTPQTKAGEYAKALGEFAPGALLPGSAVSRVASVVAPALTSETAAQLAKGTDLEGPARFAGALVGGLGVSGAQGFFASPQRVAGAAMGNVADEQLARAVELMKSAQARGIRLTPAEAVQQVTGGATGLGRMQRVIEGTTRGAERLAPIMAERPAQVRGAVTQFADTIAPATDQPSMIGVRAQEAGQGALDKVRQAINARAEGNYAALRGQTIPDEQYLALQSDASYQRALQALRSDPELGAKIAGLPDNDLSVVNEVVKQLDTMAEGARQTAMNPAGNNYLASLRGDARTQADALARQASGDYAAARDTVAAGREALLNPLEAGPLGRIAQTDQVPQQTAALYPAAPLEGAPAETALAMQGLGPVGADLTRQHLMNTLNEATQNLQGGANQFGGAKYAAVIAGNPEQAATLRAGLDVVRPGAADEFDALTEALMATGKREPAGSQTTFNTQQLKELSDLPPAANAAGNIFDITKWPSAVSRGLKDIQFKRNVDELAKALSATPEEAEAFLRAAQRARPRTNLTARLLMSGQAAQGDN